jgi:hypothetical protein
MALMDRLAARKIRMKLMGARFFESSRGFVSRTRRGLGPLKSSQPKELHHVPFMGLRRAGVAWLDG